MIAEIKVIRKKYITLLLFFKKRGWRESKGSDFMLDHLQSFNDNNSVAKCWRNGHQTMRNTLPTGVLWPDHFFRLRTEISLALSAPSSV